MHMDGTTTWMQQSAQHVQLHAPKPSSVLPDPLLWLTRIAAAFSTQMASKAHKPKHSDWARTARHAPPRAPSLNEATSKDLSRSRPQAPCKMRGCWSAVVSLLEALQFGYKGSEICRQHLFTWMRRSCKNIVMTRRRGKGFAQLRCKAHTHDKLA